MTDKDWLSLACRFFLGQSTPYRYTHGPGREVYIETRPQMDGSIKWIVKMDNWCLGKDNQQHYEPIPSSRTDEFITLTRFDSKEEAYKAWVKHEASFPPYSCPKLYVP